jgi:hypothetical protein
MIAVLAAILFSAVPASAQRPLDGATADRWEPRTGWVQALPEAYGVTNEGGVLVFAAKGAGAELPWQITLVPEEIGGDARYLAIRYRAEGLANPPGNYFLHGWEGTVGGLTYAFSDELQPDGAWHTLAVDLLKVMPQGDTTQVAVKAIVGPTGSAKLTVERVWFTDDLPADATVSRAGAREAKSIALDWAKLPALTPAPTWTQSPATDFGATLEGTVITFRVRGAGKQMRWPLALPEPVDLRAIPHFALRYKASGQLGADTYAVWLGDDATGAGQHSAHPLLARDVIADGQWHRLDVQQSQSFTATQLAVGLDCAGDEATMTLDTISFSSAPARWPIGQVLSYEQRAPEALGGFTLLPPATGGSASPFLGQRLGLSDWFASPDITVGGIPFAVPASPGEVQQSGSAALGTLSVALAPAAAEVYLLTAAVAPATEPWGIDWAHPRPVEMLSVPEKLVCEVRYADGPPDFMLPVDVATGGWGLKRGLGVCVVHPDPTRRPTELLLHDRMRGAAFAILGATLRPGVPRTAEPSSNALACPEPPAGALQKITGAPRNVPGFPLVRSGKLFAEFALMPAFGWSALRAGGSDDALACSRGPVFEVEVDGQVLPQKEWQQRSFESVGQGMRFVLEHPARHLRATLDCAPGVKDGVRMQLSLENTGAEPTTATIRFPVLRGVRLGSVDDTWFLFEKRGGIINREPVSFREALGDPHPLQVDGFFNPKAGLALACLTHDTAAQHHFIDMGKSADGGSWSPEYVRRDLLPGSSFTTTEAELILREGDWRAILGAYREWLKAWFRPPAPKPWWERTFAFLGCNAHYDYAADPKARGAIQPRIDTALKHLGLCDYVHLFGWSSSKTYGDWGDYDHYDETVGGLDYFRGNLAAAQAKGVGVGLYQDGYLSCGKGLTVRARAEEWAMKRADGTPNFVPEYDAYNECPYNEQWRAYLAATYKRIEAETGAKGLYIDEYGATDGRWACYAKDHGHNGYEVPYAGEVATLRAIREAVGPEVALYTEYPSAEVSRQVLDGSFTYQALWSAEQEPLAPHFIDLPRFAFPHFKQFHIIYYVTPRDGNWWLLKFPFFNGESYDVGEPGLAAWDDEALAFQKRALGVLCAHREAFSSHDVEPLVRTEAPGVFANEFRAANETVWTLYNANGRSVHQPVLKVEHVRNATYEDAWTGQPIRPEVRGETALLAVELGPKAVGCVVQRRGG